MTTPRGRTFRTLSRVTAAIDLLVLAAAAEALVAVAAAMVAELERLGVVDLDGVRADLEAVRDGR